MGPETKKAKILVIDDEPGVRSMLTYHFTRTGFQVETAGDALSGIEMVKKNKFDIVITDIKMPKMDGISGMEAIKKISPETEVIVATGYGTIETAVASLKKGAYDFIQKPFNLDEISALIDKALEKSELKAIVALYETSKAIFSKIKLEDLLESLVDISLKFLNADDVSIMFMGPDHKLTIAASHGLDDSLHKEVRVSLGERIAGKVAENKQSALINGPLENDERFKGMESRPEIKSAIVSPLLSKSREVLGVFCVARTLKEHSFNDKDLKHADIFVSQISQAFENVRLYEELEKKINDLNDAYAVLKTIQEEMIQKEKLAAIGELSSGVAHELNNPLTAIIGLTDLLIEGDSHTPEDREDFVRIRTQADRCRKIILNLMHFARKHKAEKILSDINSVINSTLDLAQYEFKNTNIQIIRNLDSTVPPLLLDSNQMQQVFMNIITNARHALENRPDAELSISTRHDACQVVVEFIDNGCGIPKNMIGKIFDPFFTTKEVGKGTGLGLSISYGIVKEHGGKIEVQSQENKGTTLSVTLPFENNLSAL